MDLKKYAQEMVEKLQKDDDLLEKFGKDPIATLEKLIGVDLPNDQLEALADLVKTKLDLDKLGNAIGALGGLGGLFGKK